jgi:hypothetical protein
MATIQPKGERVKQAIKWISMKRGECENQGISTLIQEASTRFNLTPLEEEFLWMFYKKGDAVKTS